MGDTVLPDISPFPTREAFFHQVSGILPSEYSSPDCVYGLRAYIRSLKKLKSIGERFPDALVLPAHRLFHNRHWNEIDCRTRITEIIDHHILRCAEILKILKDENQDPQGDRYRAFFSYLAGGRRNVHGGERDFESL